MTFIFPIAIVVLAVVIYGSSAISFFPIGIGYLLFLYSLKELQKSKMKNTFFLLGIVGLGISLFSTSFLLAHDVVLSIILCFLTFELDKRHYYIQISVFVTLLSLFVGHFISSKNLWFAGLFVLLVCLYFIYQNTNVFLQNEPYENKHPKIKQLPPTISITLLILSTILALFLYQEYHFQLNQEYYAGIYYTIDNSTDDFEYQITPSFVLDKSEGYYLREPLFSFLKVPARYLDYQIIDFYVYTDKEVDWARYERRQDVEQPTDNIFPIYHFFEKTGYGASDIEALFKYNQPITINVILDNGIYPAESFEKDTLTLVKHDALFEGRSLFSKVYMLYDGQYDGDMQLHFSVYISNLVNKTRSINYDIYQVSKETNEKTLISSESLDNIIINGNSQRIYLGSGAKFDFDNYNYEISYKLYNEYGDLLFKDQVVTKQ